MKKNKIILLIFLICGALFLTSNFIVETDYLWHIKAGEYMFKHGPLTHDVFSWFTAGKYWMSHEWLFEVFLYIMKLLFGKYHTLIYCFLCVSALFGIMYIPNRESFSKNIFFSLVFMVFTICMMIGFIQARPHMIGFVFLAITIYFLYDLYKNEKSKKIYFLPLVTILWSNMHGGSSNLSYLMCLMFLGCGLFKFKLGKIEADRFSKKQLLTYLIVSVLCMISVCINIHGFKMFIYPYENMADTTMLKNILEWQPTSFSSLNHYAYYLYLLLMLIPLIFSKKKIKLLDLLLLGFATFLGLKSIRFWVYSPVIMSFVIFGYVNEAKTSSFVLSVLIGLIIGLIVISVIKFANMNIKYEISLNKKIVNTIKKENPKRLYNMYNYGGELIYNDIKVFVDGRADLYSKHNLKDYLNLTNWPTDNEELIEKYNFDYMLVDKEYQIYTYIKDNDNYEVIYENKELVLYKKIVN